MNVSRETSLDVLLLLIADKVQFDSLVAGDGSSLSGLTRPALGLVLLSLIKNLNRSITVIFDDNLTAERIYSDCLSLKSESIAYFPETVQSEMAVAGFNLENERYRSEAVNLIRSNHIGLVFASTIASEELAIDDILDIEQGYMLKSSAKIDRNEIINTIVRWGYENVDHTETPKTYSVRGGILDLFLPYSANPIRVEFFGNNIESIRIFNPRSQRTIKNIDSIELLPPPKLGAGLYNKISLIKLLDNAPIRVVEKDSVFTVNLGNNKFFIDLSCKDVVIDSDINIENQLSLAKSINQVSYDKTFLFSGGLKSTKTIEKYNLENCRVINFGLSGCFYSSYLNILCLSANSINKQRPIQKSRWAVETVSEIPQKEFSSLNELDWGDYLVHQDFGIGLYRGLEIIKTRDNIEQECIKIEYAGGASVYVPVEKFNRVHKMIVTGNNDPALSTLNGPKWKRQIKLAKDSAKAVVQDLIKLYASRNRKRGFTYNKNDSFMQELKSSFQFDETPGQAAAIEAVTNDMEKDSPVDRLVCGDVGFGKTEVALRAALKSIVSGKKVLLLTPTTILADQHFISTKARFEPLGIGVELLSRFKTKKQQQEILEKMLTGSIDLVIGTHRLLSQDVKFPDLGLLIIDEEHRFGVKHKEKLRQLRSTVDVITLTATPIPRTLQQSLLGIRDISRISTPPKTRRPIKTFIHYLDWKNIREVISIELNRGGQIYFLHNDIASIPFILKKMLKLFPSNTIGVAHGKMNSSELENTVLSFFSGDIDILLCTTIIESGLDVSNANTIIINNAQNFGLSQLYQIRGRVGRSHRQAYCYLLVPKGKTISENARKRLKAIEQYTSLGSGYEISLKDLEIRGAGNLFGYKQSGHIATVGFEMYCKILQEAVDETIGDINKKIPPKISIPINALLDKEYIQLVQDRLYFYQQLSDASLLKTADDIQEELIDRFGNLPKSAQNLIEITRIRIMLTGTSISSVSIIGSNLKINLSDFAPYSSADELIRIVGEKLALQNMKFQFTPTKNGLLITAHSNNMEQSIKLIELFVELFNN